MERSNLIGISGKIGSGKDTVGQIIQFLDAKQRYGMPSMTFNAYQQLNDWSVTQWRIKKFADPMKSTVCMWLGCSRENLESQEFKNTPLGEEWDGMTPRRLLQLLGTDAGREVIHPNLWVNVAFRHYRDGCQWIFTDTRFPNEAKAIRDRGGTLIRVKRTVETTPEVANHPSETSLDNWKDWDHVIDNNGTIEDLIENVKAIIP